jgi:hypothetical protein
MTLKQIDAMKLALEALEGLKSLYGGKGHKLHEINMIHRNHDTAITALEEALAEHAMKETQRLGQEIEQEPVAWLLTDKKINSLQVDDIQRLISRLKHAHHTDLCVRINGHDEWFEADWLKHMVRVTPPQRTWVGLTDEEENEYNYLGPDMPWVVREVAAILKEKNK